MTRDERVEDLRVVWGPPPSEPGARSVWEHGMQLLADLPEAVASLVEANGSDSHPLSETFGLLPRLEGEVIWRFLMVRAQEEIREAVLDVLHDQPWQAALFGHSSLRRTRTANRLADDVTNNLGRVVLMEPRYRAWLMGE